MEQRTERSFTDPRLGFLNLVPVAVLVLIKLWKISHRVVRGISRSISSGNDVAPKSEATVRTEAAPSKLREAVDEAPARVVRRSTRNSSTTSDDDDRAKSIWARAPAMKIADCHAEVDISGKRFRFSVYRTENEIQRVEMGSARKEKSGPRKPLAPFTRSTAASERVAFTLEEAIEFTRREIAAARRRGTSRKTEAPTATPQSHPEPQKEQPPQPTAEKPSMDDGISHWVDMPCFEELEAQAPSRPQAPAPARPAAPVRPPEPVRAAAPRPQQPIHREPPPPPASQPKSGLNGVEEGPPDFRGARRVTGTVVGLGIIEVKKPKKDPFEIYAITLRTREGDEEQFRGYELEKHVETNSVAVGDTISLKRGRQQFWQIRNGVRNEKLRNIYDFQVVNRARR